MRTKEGLKTKLFLNVTGKENFAIILSLLHIKYLY